MLVLHSLFMNKQFSRLCSGKHVCGTSLLKLYVNLNTPNKIRSEVYSIFSFFLFYLDIDKFNI